MQNLVEKNSIAMYRHTHNLVSPTWSHVSRVEEIACATSKQPKKNKAAAKHNFPLKLSCGSRSAAAPT
jgi:hypothetical protein